MLLLLPFDEHLCHCWVSVQCLVLAMLVDPGVTPKPFGHAARWRSLPEGLTGNSKLKIRSFKIKDPTALSPMPSRLRRMGIQNYFLNFELIILNLSGARVTADFLVDIDCYKSNGN
ncbi:hypothetical protein NIES4073_28070 [Kalymmatonema gypsitolerans NIES-4073]|nr:hypothetical protein NIES4073_28070 [Scytonema sp. NIES-4073]